MNIRTSRVETVGAIRRLKTRKLQLNILMFFSVIRYYFSALRTSAGLLPVFFLVSLLRRISLYSSAYFRMVTLLKLSGLVLARF